MKRTTQSLLALLLSLNSAIAQPSQEFSAVSIKPNQSGLPNSETDTSPGRISLINATPISLLLRAFGVQRVQIIDAPRWAMEERFDVVAVTGGIQGLNEVERQPYFQAMLTERWQLRFHREMRQMNVLVLQSDRRGVKLQAGTGTYGMKVGVADGKQLLRSTEGNIPRLVEILSGATGSLMVNETGLNGAYDFTLEWIQDVSSDAPGAALSTALREQLGLTLVEAKRPVEVIVIDRFERPSEN